MFVCIQKSSIDVLITSSKLFLIQTGSNNVQNFNTCDEYLNEIRHSITINNVSSKSSVIIFEHTGK